jgi:CheY-like chemotaxis protein
MPMQVEPTRLSSEGHAIRILIFENDEAIAYGFAAILRSANFAVEVTTRFWDALRTLEGNDPPDLLVADIVMPEGEVNGMAMARMARMKRPSIKILYITGYDLAAVEREALGPILRKPVSEEELLSAVRGLIENV